MAVIGNVWTPDERLTYIYSMIKVDMKDIALDFYQDELIRSNAVFLAILKARQIGWSFLAALKGLALANDPARIKYTKQFVSYNEEDAREKIHYAQEFYDSIPRQFRKKLKHRTSTSMEFIDQGGKTTSRLISIACRPPRGKNGDISFDEMAFYPVRRCHGIYTAGVNAIALGGHIEVGSTPLGAVGMFYDILTNPDFEGYDRYTVPWWFSKYHCNDVEKASVSAPEMATEERVFTFGTKKLISIYKTNFLEDFQQEQECKFIDSKGSFISLELIHANTPGMREGERLAALADDDAGEEELEIRVAKTAEELALLYNPEKHGTIYLGYDVARRRDAAVIYAIGYKDGIKRSLAEIEMRDTPFEEQLNTLRAILRWLSPVRCCMDQTGMGEPIYERLQKEYGGDRIEGVAFTAESKEILAVNVKRGLENREFLLPNDQGFHLQIHSIKRTPTLAGRFRYDAERDEKGHADSFWAWALAGYAVTRQASASRPGFYQQLKAKKADASRVKSAVSETAHQAALTRGKTREQVLQERLKLNGERLHNE